MKTFLLLFCLFLTLQVKAAVIKVAVITSDIDDNVTDYFVETDEQNRIESMRYVTTMPNGGIFEDITVTAENVLTDGAVIVERNGHKVVRLEVENFSLETGGTVILNYLYNGATGSRQIKKLNLQLTNGEFQLFDQGKRVNRLFLVGHRKRIIGIVGVKTIKASYSAD